MPSTGQGPPDSGLCGVAWLGGSRGRETPSRSGEQHWSSSARCTAAANHLGRLLSMRSWKVWLAPGLALYWDYQDRSKVACDMLRHGVTAAGIEEWPEPSQQAAERQAGGPTVKGGSLMVLP